MKTAFLFPGQGSQYTGMGQDLYDNFSIAREIFSAADNYLGFKISDICFNGDSEVLKQTQNTQPALAIVSIAFLEVLKQQTGLIPDYVAGHSLGEYSALYAAGVINLEQTMKLLYKRGILMSSIKGGGMAAIIGGDEELINNAISDVKDIGYVGIANYNSPAQTVITGDLDAINALNEILAGKIKRFVLLPVSGAFHSEYMKKIAPEFTDFVNNFDLKDAKIPIITNVDASPETNHENLKRKMTEQLYSSVHWHQSIDFMVKNGVERFIEIGAGKVLTGLNKRMISDKTILSVNDVNSLNEVTNNIKGVI